LVKTRVAHGLCGSLSLHNSFWFPENSSELLQI
jgi:hypothetical protein